MRANRDQTQQQTQQQAQQQAQAKQQQQQQQRQQQQQQQWQQAQQQGKEQKMQPGSGGEQPHEHPREQSRERGRSTDTAEVRAQSPPRAAQTAAPQQQRGPQKPTPMRLRGGGRRRRRAASDRDGEDSGGDESGGEGAGNGGAGKKRRGRGSTERRKERRADKQAEWAAARGTAAQQPEPTGQAMEAREQEAGHAGGQSQLGATAAMPLTSGGDDAFARGASPTSGQLPTLPPTRAGTSALTEDTNLERGPARGRAVQQRHESRATQATTMTAAAAQAGEGAPGERPSHAGSSTDVGTGAAPRAPTLRAAERAPAISADNPALASAVSRVMAATYAHTLAEAAAVRAATEERAIAAWTGVAGRALAEENTRAAVQEITEKALAATAEAGASAPCKRRRQATHKPSTSQDAPAEERYARPRTEAAVEWHIAQACSWEANVEATTTAVAVMIAADDVTRARQALGTAASRHALPNLLRAPEPAAHASTGAEAALASAGAEAALVMAREEARAALGGQVAPAEEGRAAPAEDARAAPADAARAEPAEQAARREPMEAARQAEAVQAGGREGRAAAPADTSGDGYARSLDITVRLLAGDTFNIDGIQLGHETRELYDRIAVKRGLQPEAMRLSYAGVDLPNDGTLIGVTAIARSQYPTIHLLPPRAAATTSPSVATGEATDPTGTEHGDAIINLQVAPVRVAGTLTKLGSFRITNVRLDDTTGALYEQAAEAICEHHPGLATAGNLRIGLVYEGAPLPKGNMSIGASNLARARGSRVDAHVLAYVRTDVRDSGDQSDSGTAHDDRGNGGDDSTDGDGRDGVDGDAALGGQHTNYYYPLPRVEGGPDHHLRVEGLFEGGLQLELESGTPGVGARWSLRRHGYEDATLSFSQDDGRVTAYLGTRWNATYHSTEEAAVAVALADLIEKIQDATTWQVLSEHLWTAAKIDLITHAFPVVSCRTEMAKLTEDHIWPRFVSQTHLGKCKLGRLLARHVEDPGDDADALRKAMSDVEDCTELLPPTAHCAKLEAALERARGELREAKAEARRRTERLAIGAPADLPEMPNEFHCPILKTVMRDPVVAADGYTYERSALLRYFREGRYEHRSPMTGLEMDTTTLDNTTRRILIQEWPERTHAIVMDTARAVRARLGQGMDNSVRAPSEHGDDENDSEDDNDSDDDGGGEGGKSGGRTQRQGQGGTGGGRRDGDDGGEPSRMDERDEQPDDRATAREGGDDVDGAGDEGCGSVPASLSPSPPRHSARVGDALEQLQLEIALTASAAPTAASRGETRGNTAPPLVPCGSRDGGGGGRIPEADRTDGDGEGSPPRGATAIGPSNSDGRGHRTGQ